MFLFFTSLLAVFYTQIEAFLKQTFSTIPSGVTINAKVNLFPKGTADYL